MSSDLKWIKKHYSEKLMHICRENFPTLLEQEGLLKKILSEHFAPSKSLGRDIEEQNKILEFKNYIYSFVDAESKIKQDAKKTVEELMDEAGYVLYPECKTEADIQSFRHYYYCGGKTPVYTGGDPEDRSGEELCTFNGGRLQSCRVWFAVKKDVEKIKRKDFKNPDRQDEYGTSVISIQFTRGKNSTLSIKNRYNHTVNNPDSTFSNNLDNIIPGLTQAFEEQYGINLTHKQSSSFELGNYVRALDGKYYRYNMEINNIYYCENNVILENFEAKKLDPRYVLMDYFIVDLSTNTVKSYDKNIKDSFIESLGEIEKITYEADTVRIKVKNGADVLITLDEHRAITKLYNPNLTQCGDCFMYFSDAMEEISLPNLIECGSGFLCSNHDMTKLSLPNLTQCGNNFMANNEAMTELSLPNLTRCGDRFVCYNTKMRKLNLPKLTQCGDKFMGWNLGIGELSLPNLTKCGYGFMGNNAIMTKLNLPNLTECGSDFMYSNQVMTELNLPNLTKCSYNFMFNNKYLKKLSLPKLIQCADGFMYANESIRELNLKSLTSCGDFFMMNATMTELSLPNLTKCGDDFMFGSKYMKKLSLPKLTKCGDAFLQCNEVMTELSLPNLTRCGDSFMSGNSAMIELNLPNLTECGTNFMYCNKSLTKIDLSKLSRYGDGFMRANKAMRKLILPKLTQRIRDFIASLLSN